MKISSSEFRKAVTENANLALVQFKVDWSGACQIISPLFNELAGTYKGQAEFFTIDVEKNEGINTEYGVTELPTILFFRAGKVIDHIRGLVPRNLMISKIEEALNNKAY
ncbi:MAG: thioredoxin domain-containing protein [Chitinophagaceae bacterium]